MTDSDSAAGEERDATRVEALLKKHLPGLRGFLRRRASDLVLERESVDDLTQSVCRDLLVHLQDGRFDVRTDAEFKRWLYEAGLLKLKGRVRFHLADKRDAGRERGAVGSFGSGDPGIEPATSATPSRLAATEETRARVREAIAGLGDRDAAILSLVVLEGRSHADAAEALGLEVAHCRMVLSRAMAKLAASLQSGESGGAVPGS